MKSNILLSPPALEPVTLAEIKAHARIEDSSDDSLLEALIASARQWCEAFTRRAFLSQTWALYLSGRPRGEMIVLPRAPLMVVNKVESFDEDDMATVWDASNYYVNIASVPGEIVLRNGAVWPSALRRANGIVVEYVAGYGEEIESVPQDIRLAIKQLALHWYEHRGEALTSAGYAKAPLTIEALLHPYRILKMGGACA